MHEIKDVETLKALYGTPSEAATIKVAKCLTAPYRQMIEASPFVMLATAGPEGLDCSPRGDADAVVRVIDETTLHLPDWKGNNRVDSLMNIVRDGRVGMLFLIPGSGSTMRLNGTAILSVDPILLAEFQRDGHHPRSVIVITIGEVYVQCARAIARSGLWDPTRHRDQTILPSSGDMFQAAKADFDGRAYDVAKQSRTNESLW